MMKNQPAAKTIDEYILHFPKAIQNSLRTIRKLVSDNAPDATEKISYGIPTFALHGNLVHFAAYDTHLGFYPGASALIQFQKELANYDTAKGTIRLPLDTDVPKDLLKKIIQFRVEENLEKHITKKKLK